MRNKRCYFLTSRLGGIFLNSSETDFMIIYRLHQMGLFLENKWEYVHKEALQTEKWYANVGKWLRGARNMLSLSVGEGLLLGLGDTLLMSAEVSWGTAHKSPGEIFSFSIFLWYVEKQISMRGEGTPPNPFQIDSCNFLSYDSYHYISLFYSFKKISSSVIM